MDKLNKKNAVLEENQPFFSEKKTSKINVLLLLKSLKKDEHVCKKVILNLENFLNSINRIAKKKGLE